MNITVVREACCAADDQLGPLEATFAVGAHATLGELIEQIRAARFLQFSSTHNRLSGDVDSVRLVEVGPLDGPHPTFHVDEASPVSSVIGDRTLHFYFR